VILPIGIWKGNFVPVAPLPKSTHIAEYAFKFSALTLLVGIRKSRQEGHQEEHPVCEN